MGVIQLKYGSGSSAPTSLKNGEFAINVDTNQLWYGSGSANTPVSDIRLNSITAEKYILSSSVTHMTTSFSSGSTEFGDSADDTHTFTGNITASGTLKIGTMTYPTSDGVDGQVLITDGAGVLTFDDNVTYVIVKNVESGQLTKGTPVHVTGTSGNTPEVVAASASLATHMPANFVLAEDLSADAEGRAILTGKLNGINTSNGFSEGENIYIAPAGGYTPTKPVGDNLIQNIGIVVRTDATNGSIFVTGAGRTNDVPNLDENNIFIGNSSNTSQAANLGSSITSQGDITIGGDLKINGNEIKGSSGNVILSSISDVVKAPLGLATNTVSGYNNADFELKAGGNIQFTLDTDNNETAQSFSFRDGGDYGNFTEIANLDQDGNLQISGDLDVDGEITASGDVMIGELDDDNDHFLKIKSKGDTSNHYSGIQLKHETEAYGFTLQSQDGVDSIHGLNILKHQNSVGGSSALLINRLSDSIGIFNISPTASLDITGDLRVSTNITASGNISSSGDVQYSGALIGKQREIYFNNFEDKIGTSKVYIPLISALEQSSPAVEEACFLAPCDGRIVSVTVRPHIISAGSDCTVTVDISTMGLSLNSTTTSFTAEESKNHTMEGSDDYHAFHYVFDNAKHFESGELVAIGIQSDVNIDSGPYTMYWYVSTVVEYDWNNQGLTAHSEYSSAQ